MTTMSNVRQRRLEAQVTRLEARLGEVERELGVARAAMQQAEERLTGQPAIAAPAAQEVAGRKASVLLSSTEDYRRRCGDTGHTDSIWHGATPPRRTRIHRIIVATPTEGCQLERVDLMGHWADAPLVEGPRAVETLDGPIDVSMVIPPSTPLVLCLSGKAEGVGLIVEDVP